jgi:hypothetical protein
MSWKLMMSWLMGLLLICSGPLASACDASCQLRGPNSCCHTTLSSECLMPRCSSSAACNGTMHQSTAEAAMLRDSLPLAAPESAKHVPAMFHPWIAASQTTMHVRLHPPLQNRSGFDPLLVSLQI